MASKGEFKQAADLYQLALDKHDSAATVIAYTRALQASDQAEKAIPLLTDAMTRFPNQPELPLALALIYQSSNQPEKATAAYERVLELAPDSVLALNNLAWILHENNDERALDLAERAYQLSPQSAAIADTYGWILFAKSRFEESVDILEKALQLTPDAEDIARHLAEAYQSNGQAEKAKQILENL